MKATVSGISITPRNLQIGIRVELVPDGPVRFLRLVIEDDDLDWRDIAALYAFADRTERRHLERERELDDELPLS